MSELLLLNLRAEESASEICGDWLLWDSAQRHAVARGELRDGVVQEELKAHSRVNPCIVLVPGEQVLQLSVTLPVGGASAEAALPYQVEEKLSCELESVHLAHEKIRAGQPCKVWVVDRDTMAGWHGWLQSSGLRVKALLPDYSVFAPPLVFRDQNRSVAQMGDCAASMEHALFDCWRLQSTVDNSQPLYLCTENAPDAAPDTQQQAVASQLDASARHFAMPANNLCQDAYLLHDVVQDTVAMLRWPALAAVLVLVLHWTLLATSAVNYAQRAEQLDQAAEGLYRETFPDARKVVNARSQMKSQLNALESQRGDTGLLTLLAPVTAAFKGQSNITATQLVFQNQTGSLRLAVDATNYGAIDAFSSQLQSRQLQVSRGTFRQNGELISGQLIITRGAGQ